jgi:hypothetical protein
MTDRPDLDIPTGPVLTANSWGRTVRLAFSAFRPVDEYIAEYLVLVSAEGLEVRSPVVTSVGGDDLPGYIAGLAEDFRGWPGVRRWRSLEDQLRVEATWNNGGHVVLRFHVRPSVYDAWQISVDITLEAGEQMKRLSQDLKAFLSK